MLKIVDRVTSCARGIMLHWFPGCIDWSG